MRQIILCFIVFLFPMFLLGQNLEVDGTVKISSMLQDNTAQNAVVRLTDGVLGMRNVTTLSEFQVLSMANDTLFLTQGGFVVLPPINICSNAIGDTFAGGIIFYLDGSGCHGLVAKTSDEPGLYQWTPLGSVDSWAFSQGIFGGDQNTKKILYKLGSGNAPAADVCAGLTDGGYADWYLPSKDELDLIYINLQIEGLGGFIDGEYWSSTAVTSLGAYAQDFLNGIQSQELSNSNKLVRAVRRF